jgi:hypothetical protein
MRKNGPIKRKKTGLLELSILELKKHQPNAQMLSFSKVKVS